MSAITFQKATKRQLPARIALDGPTGAGKTWSGLVLATELGKRICWIDTERRSASLYADHYEFDTFQFDPPYDPSKLVDVIRAAEAEGYDVIGVDSLSHFWEGEGGTLDIVDGAARSQFGGNKYAGWSVATPQLRRLVDTMLGIDCHLIVTMRSKMEYVEATRPNGSKTYEKVGMAPIMRGGIEYEFTLVGDMDLSHTLHVSKSRCDLVTDKTYQPGAAGDLAKEFKAWLDDGEPVATTEETARIKAVVLAAPDADAVKAVGRTWGERFGPVNQLLQSRFEEGLAYAQELLAQYGPPVATDDDFGFGETEGGLEPPRPTETGAAASTPSSTDAGAAPLTAADVTESAPEVVVEQPESASDAPTAPAGDTAENLQMDLEMAIKGLPTAKQQGCRDELRKTFGDLSSASVEDLQGALGIVKGWPIGDAEPIHTPNAASLPGATEKPLNTKQRQLVAYARGIGVDEAQLRALAAMLRGSSEPRPLSELDDDACVELTVCANRVKHGEIVFETPSGVLIAKEVTSV